MVKIKKMLTVLMAATLITGLASGCGQANTSKSDTSTPSNKEVDIKFFSNLPDKTTGQGKLEQTLLDNYMKENKNVKITVESLQDEPYKQKFTTYAASNQLPDIFNIWGSPAFFQPVMQNGYVAELNKDDFKDYGFFNGSLDGFSLNGKLYGLPRNSDYTALYYNKAIFTKYNVPIPTTFDDIVADAAIFRKNGIAPISMDGKDKWPIALLYDDLVVKESGDQKLMPSALKDPSKFTSDPTFLKAAQDLKSLVDAKGFQDSFVSADYGAANNLFAQGKAAMYYMGEWESGMATNKAFSDDFKKNVNVMAFPTLKSGKGKVTDLLSWNGGGYAVSANSKVKNEAIKLLKYMMKPENWTKIGWQTSAVIPAQKYDQFETGTESNLQKQLTDILVSGTSSSGMDWNDSLTPDFKTNIETLCQEFAAGMKTPEQFIKEAQTDVQNANK